MNVYIVCAIHFTVFQVQSACQSSVESICICFGLALLRFVIGLIISYRSVIQWEVRPKPSVTRSCIFPALFAVIVYFSLDWFIGLSAFFVIVPFANLSYKPTDYFASLLSNLSSFILLFSDLCQVVLTRRGQQMFRRSASYNRSQMQRLINW